LEGQGVLLLIFTRFGPIRSDLYDLTLLIRCAIIPAVQANHWNG
jgi:hypothetical protein